MVARMNAVTLHTFESKKKEVRSIYSTEDMHSAHKYRDYKKIHTNTNILSTK